MSKCLNFIGLGALHLVSTSNRLLMKSELEVHWVLVSRDYIVCMRRFYQATWNLLANIDSHCSIGRLVLCQMEMWRHRHISHSGFITRSAAFPIDRIDASMHIIAHVNLFTAEPRT